MLTYMRNNAKSWFFKIILFIIALVFVSWGVGSFSSKRANLVAMVDGSPIMMDEYKRTYDNLVDRIRARMGGALNEKLLTLLNVERQAINELIQRKLIINAAEDMKFVISDEQLQKAIMSYNVFQRNGNFDETVYKQFLLRLRMTPQDFEKNIKEDLLIQQATTALLKGIVVSENELKDFYDFENQERVIEYILIKKSGFEHELKPEDIDDNEIKAYFESHQERYQRPEEREAIIIGFRWADFVDEMVPDEDDIKDVYNIDEERFALPRQVNASHILIKVSPDAPEDIVKEALDKSNEILEKIKKGADFADMAKQFSQGPSAENGGDLGFFKKTEMTEPFARKAFSMEKGEISEPVRTDFGFHIIKVNDIREAQKKSLVEVRDIIVEELKKDMAKDMAVEQAEVFAEQLQEEIDFNELELIDHAYRESTGLFSYGDPPPVIRGKQEMLDVIFMLNPNELSGLMEFDDGYYILQVDKINPPSLPEFSNVKELVFAEWKEEKKDELALKLAEQLASDIYNGKTAWEDAVIESGADSITTSGFTRYGSIPGITSSQIIVKNAFMLFMDKPYIEKAIKTGDDYCIIRLKDIKKARADNFDIMKPEMEKKFLEQKQMERLNAWLEGLKSKAKIEEYLNIPER